MIIDWSVSYCFTLNSFSPVINFEIPLMNNQKAYIQYWLDKNSDEYCIVLLDALAFLGYWGRSGNDDRFPNYHLGDRELWRKDKYFAEAVRSFSVGMEKPSYLPTDTVILNDASQIRLGGLPGRVFWLLYHYADYIPISVSTREMAKRLKSVIGRPYCSIYSFSELRQFYENEPAEYIPRRF